MTFELLRGVCCIGRARSSSFDRWPRVGSSQVCGFVCMSYWPGCTLRRTKPARFHDPCRRGILKLCSRAGVSTRLAGETGTGFHEFHDYLSRRPEARAVLPWAVALQVPAPPRKLKHAAREWDR